MQTAFQIQITADPKLVNKLGGMGLSNVQAFSEFINNSVANKFNSSVKVTIEIAVSKNNPSDSYIKISDDASGIPDNRLMECLCLCGTANSSSNPLSEHGIGLKAGIQTLGQLRRLSTKVIGNSYAYVVDFPKGYDWGQYDVKPEACSFEHGTEIIIRELKQRIKKEWITGTLIKNLGQRYRYRLNSDLKINVIYVDLDDSTETTFPVAYDTPKVKFTDHRTFNGVKVDISLAYTKTERVQNKLPHDPSNPLMHSGPTIEYIKDNVVVCVSDDISKLSSIRSNNMYLPVRIEVYCDNFHTVLAKTDLEDSDEFKSLMQSINDAIKHDTRFTVEKKATKRTENAKKKALVKKLQNYYPDSTFDREAYCANMNGTIDVLQTDNKSGKKFVWECKAEEATGADVVQLWGYMELGDNYEKEGYMVAKKLGNGGKAAINRLKTKGYTIHFKPWSTMI